MEGLEIEIAQDNFFTLKVSEIENGFLFTKEAKSKLFFEQTDVVEDNAVVLIQSEENLNLLVISDQSVIKERILGILRFLETCIEY